MTRPTFLVIGAMKCGTTSLHHYLMLHPEIQIPPVKEPNFFSGPAGSFPYPAGSRRVDTLEKYERMFDGAYRARGEASPNYTTHPRREGVPERIKAVVPDAKLIYIVRDPVVRTVSQYQLEVSSTGESRSLAGALGDLSDPYSIYTCPSFYARQLERYLRHFPQEQIMVVDQADLLADRVSTLRSIFGFLCVQEGFSHPGFEERLNTSSEHRTYSRFVGITMRARSSPLQKLPRGLRVAMRRSVERVVSRPLPPPELDEGLRGRLQELYAEDAGRLRELTGLRFGSWCV